MKSLRKLLLLVVSVVGLFLITGLILSFTYEDAVIKYLKKYLDKHLTTEIEVSRIRFSFIKKFPNATVELRNITIHSGLGVNKNEFSELNTDTLLSARSVFFEFSLPGVLKNEYNLKNIRIVDGKFILLRDSRQKSNYNIWERAKDSDQEESTLTLQNIILSDTKIKYLDLFSKIEIHSDTRKLSVRADLRSTENFLSFNGYLFLHQITIGNSFKVNEKKLGIDLKMKYHEKRYTFFQSSIQSGKFTMNFEGEIDNSKNTSLALNFHANNASITELDGFYPVKSLKIRDKYALTSGLIDFEGSINGIVSKQMIPKTDVVFNIRNASVTNQTNRKKITGISMDGEFSNGTERNRSMAVLVIKNFNATQGKSFFGGAVQIKGMNSSNIEIILQSEIQVDDFIAFLNIDTFENVSGSLTTDLHFKGHLTSLKKIDFQEIYSFRKEGYVAFNDISFQLKNDRKVFRELTGKMILEDIIKLRDLSFKISDNDFNLNCNLINLPQYLFNKEFLSADAKIRSAYLDIKSLLSGTGADSSHSLFIFPERINLRSDFSIDKLIYGKFTADSIEGFVTYKPKTFNFETFRLYAVDGSIAGNANVSQTSDMRISITSFSELVKIDIQKLFFATNNFGQDVIPDKNLMGELSGNLSFTSQWDSNLKLIDTSIIANSDIEIKNGQLIDYEPMLGLSRFVHVEELKDIKFKTLKNQIYINNRKVIIPEMDIQSSAFNIKGSGIHHFDNHYDYRIQVELNELLSSKAKKRRKEIEEFGTVEDDGLGGLKIPIKIIGKGSQYDVDYDRKRAVSNFRSNIASEKEEIRNLFKTSETQKNVQSLPDDQNKGFIIDWDSGNEKKDFIFEDKDQKKKEQPQFIIEWDEDDDTTTF